MDKKNILQTKLPKPVRPEDAGTHSLLGSLLLQLVHQRMEFAQQGFLVAATATQAAGWVAHQNSQDREPVEKNNSEKFIFSFNAGNDSGLKTVNCSIQEVQGRASLSSVPSGLAMASHAPLQRPPEHVIALPLQHLSLLTPHTGVLRVDGVAALTATVAVTTQAEAREDQLQHLTQAQASADQLATERQQQIDQLQAQLKEAAKHVQAAALKGNACAEQVQQLTQAKATADQLLNERTAQIKAYEQRLQQLQARGAESERLRNLLQAELTKADAQINLIKDLLLMEKGL